MREKSNILYIAESGNINGGGEISLLNLIRNLNFSEFYPIVVLPSSGTLVQSLHEIGIECHVLPMPRLRNPLHLPKVVKLVFTLSRLIQNKDIKLIHSNATARGSTYGVIAARLNSIPFIWHARVMDRDIPIDILLTSLSTKIIVTSKAMKSRFPYVKDKIYVIYNGVDTYEFSPKARDKELMQSLGLHENITVVGSIGRFVPYKGYKYFIEAAKLVVNTENVKDVIFVIVGDGPIRNDLEEEVRRANFTKYVFFLGYQFNIPTMLSIFDIFVLPSLREHFGRVVIEAMACAKPVVATSAGGVPEIVDNGITGVLVPPKDTVSMAAAIVELLKNKNKSQKMGLTGRERVEGFFNIKENTAKIEALYKELLV